MRERKLITRLPERESERLCPGAQRRRRPTEEARSAETHVYISALPGARMFLHVVILVWSLISPAPPLRSLISSISDLLRLGPQFFNHPIRVCLLFLGFKLGTQLVALELTALISQTTDQID